eukprot:scaffold60526_cov19-Tisochrysis_lutea.AAC.1
MPRSSTCQLVLNVKGNIASRGHAFPLMTHPACCEQHLRLTGSCQDSCGWLSEDRLSLRIILSLIAWIFVVMDICCMDSGSLSQHVCRTANQRCSTSALTSKHVTLGRPVKCWPLPAAIPHGIAIKYCVLDGNMVCHVPKEFTRVSKAWCPGSSGVHQRLEGGRRGVCEDRCAVHALWRYAGMQPGAFQSSLPLEADFGSLMMVTCLIYTYTFNRAYALH